MNKAKYQSFVEATFNSLKDLIRTKNSDYSHGDDPFANFRISEQIGIDPLAGLFIRMEDKNQRIRAFLNRGDLKVAGEGIEDAFRDLIGYSCLALGLIEERKLEQTRPEQLTLPTQYEHTNTEEPRPPVEPLQRSVRPDEWIAPIKEQRAASGLAH